MGVELAGEIVSADPTKKVTLIHSGQRLISGRDELNPKLGAQLQSQLEHSGVEVLLGERIDLESLGHGPKDCSYFIFVY